MRAPYGKSQKELFDLPLARRTDPSGAKEMTKNATLTETRGKPSIHTIHRQGSK